MGLPRTGQRSVNFYESMLELRNYQLEMVVIIFIVMDLLLVISERIHTENT